MPNSPRPSSRPRMYLSPIRVRWLSGTTSFRTRIGPDPGNRTESSEYRPGFAFPSLGFSLRGRGWWSVLCVLESTMASGLTQALQFPIV
uniref:Uncharacterized protein n=1 Tax=Rhizophora mucronata TaxID=61149 RepID=A0A2P2NJR8_RHIMU